MTAGLELMEVPFVFISPVKTDTLSIHSLLPTVGFLLSMRCPESDLEVPHVLSFQLTAHAVGRDVMTFKGMVQSNVMHSDRLGRGYPRRGTETGIPCMEEGNSALRESEWLLPAKPALCV